MQIPIIKGIYTNSDSDFRISYPKNMMPVVMPQGISNGYLRPAEGVVQIAAGLGRPRGGINWNGTCYRVMGTQLTSVASDGTATDLGNIGLDNGVNASLDYSFDRLSVVAGDNFYLYDGSTLTHVSDPDVGNVIDHVWVDGYFLLTDGEYLIVTDLDDPTSINPLRYGSSEVDPDPIKALLKPLNEVHALNRYTIEVFDNIGGSNVFPFQRIEGAQINKGVIGTDACCVFLGAVAFLGGGRNEGISLWLGQGGDTAKLASIEIDRVLAGYSEADLEKAILESRVFAGHELLYLHLKDQTLVYDAAASRAVDSPVWFTLSTDGSGKYLVKDFVRCYDKWLVANPSTYATGHMTKSLASHWGTDVDWEFATGIIYNEGRGAIVHEVELSCLSGRNAIGTEPVLYTQYSTDGLSFSAPRRKVLGGPGYDGRVNWLGQGPLRKWRIQKFSGRSDAMLTVARLDARIEPLAV